MKRLSKYEDMIVEYERSMSRFRYQRRPLHWTGKWILGKIVYVLYLTFRFALDVLYYDIFRAWRDS